MSENNETQEIGAIDFEDANLLFNLLFKQNDHLENSEEIGIALYRLRGTNKGRVVFSGTELDENKWEQVATNNSFTTSADGKTVTNSPTSSQKKFLTVYFS